MTDPEFLARLAAIRSEHESRVAASRRAAERYAEIVVELTELVPEVRVGVRKTYEGGQGGSLQAIQAQIGGPPLVEPDFGGPREVAKSEIARLVAEYVGEWGR